MNLPLTVAFNDCGAGPTHSPPINSSTCGPAQASSPDLTLGEPQVNGKPAKGKGFIKIKTLSPSNGEVKVSINDVRCKNYFSGCNSLLGDYTSFVRLALSFQITDRATPAGTAATVPLLALTTNVPCTATADTTVGSTCQVTTNINSILPGAIVTGKRASWVLIDASHLRHEQPQVPGAGLVLPVIRGVGQFLRSAPRAGRMHARCGCTAKR